MSGAFTPGLTITAYTTVRKTRLLPIPGTVLVKPGDRVNADTDIAQVDMPGTLVVAKVLQSLGCAADQVEKFCLVREGARVSRDQVIAQRSFFFGLFTNRCLSPRDGTVEYISKLSGNVGIRGDATPITCKAYIAGTVVDVIEHEGVVVETTAALLQGIFGVGGERHGGLLWIDGPGEALQGGQIGPEHRGKILLHPGRIDGSALPAAVKHGVIGLVGASMIDADLMAFLGYDIGVAITGQERIPFSLVLTEGFGTMTMPARTRELSQSLTGQSAAINGSTQIRAGVIRPEIVVPRPGKPGAAAESGGELTIGARIRCIRRPQFGQLGTVTALPEQPVEIATGSRVRVLTVKLDDGREVTIPRANVEILQL